MKQNVYCIYGDSEESYVLQLFYSSDQLAKMYLSKMFRSDVLTRQIPVIKDYPNLYSVYRVASFDDCTGKFENEDIPKLLLNFSEFAEEDQHISI